MANYGYDKNTDYTEEINKAIALGDYRSAATLEQQRNEKIRGEGLSQYQTTSHYADYLPRTDQINSGMDKLGNSKWDYDVDKDPAMQAYRKQFLREADRGTRDTMAAAAAMTGGVPSTAAVQAGQQMGNYYRSQLADKVPELMQQSYSRYMQGREADRADLNLLFNIDAQRAAESRELRQQEYERQNNAWQQAMNRWNVLGYADESVAAALGVPVGTSTMDAAYQQKQLEYQQWQQQQAEREYADNLAYRQWQQEQSERGDAYDRAITQINMGLMPDAATLAAAGLSEATARSMQAKVLQQLAQGSYSGGSSSGGGTRTVYKYVQPQKDPKKEEPPAEKKKVITDDLRSSLLDMASRQGPAAAKSFFNQYYGDYDNAAEVWNWIVEQMNNALYGQTGSGGGGSVKPTLAVTR